MAISLTTDKACGCVPLRSACIGIAIFYLVLSILDVITDASNNSSLTGFFLLLLGNAGLLFGALLENKWLVSAWLGVAILIYIGFSVLILGTIFNFGGHRSEAHFDNVVYLLLEYITIIVMFSYCTFIVLSYFNHLRNRDSKPPNQRAVIV